MPKLTAAFAELVAGFTVFVFAIADGDFGTIAVSLVVIVARFAKANTVSVVTDAAFVSTEMAIVMAKPETVTAKAKFFAT